jgi:diguanylate cyclase
MRLFPYRMDFTAVALLCATLLSAVVRQVWVILPETQGRADLLSSNLIGMVPSLCAAATCWYVGLRSTISRRAWFLLGLAAFAFFLGDLTWMVIQNVLKLDPFPSAADAFYLLVSPLVAWGVLSFPRAPFRPTEAARVTLNVAIVIAGIGTFAWRFVIAPLIEQNIGQTLPAFLVSLAYPLYDLALLSLILLILLRPTNNQAVRQELTWVLVAVMCQTTADVSFAISSIYGAEELTLPLNGFWGWFAASLAVGAFTSLQHQRVQTQQTTSSTATPLEQPTLFALLAPFIAIIGTFMLLIVDEDKATLGHEGTYVGVIFVVILVMIRQGFAFADNVALNDNLRRLSNELEARVEERTREIEWNATHDPLTGLPNRNLLQGYLESAIGRGPLAVLFIDLDGFKRINDTLGHAVGDELLRAVGARLRQRFTSRELVARTGGDEFVIVLPDTTVGDAERAGKAVITALEEAFHLNDASFGISASIGYSLAPRDGRDAETLQRHADAAMYTAKNRGHGLVQGFSSQIKAQLEERLEIEQQLRHAIQRDELELYYQPVVDARTGHLQTLEALLRWRNPTLGNVPPERFIPIAEENGLIAPLTHWVLQRACLQNAEWQRAGLPRVCVAVNISMLQIGQGELIRTIKTALEDANLESRWLQLELVESVLAQPHAAAGIEELRTLGVSIAVDDFGTGYSSLSYLGQLPVDTLKIAQAFTTNLYREGSQESALTLLEAIIGVAKSLRLSVTAEGVETDQQLQYLRQLGCDSIQGYLYAKPAPADTARIWLEAGALRALETELA